MPATHAQSAGQPSLRKLWIAALVLLGAAALAAWWQLNGTRQAKLEMFQAALHENRPGVSLYRLKRRQPQTRAFDWRYLGGAGPPYAKGPIPDQENYRVMLLAGVKSPAESPAILSAWVDDGARIWLDGKLLGEDWKPSPKRELAYPLELTPGWHLIELEFFQAGGDAYLDIALKPKGGQPLTLYALSPELDTQTWQELSLLVPFWRKLFLAACAAGLGLLLLPLAWLPLKRSKEISAWLAARPGLARWFGGGAALALAAQAHLLLVNNDGYYLWCLGLAPLLAGLIGAMLFLIVRGWNPPALAKAQSRLASYWQGLEWLLAPALFFGLFFLLSWDLMSGAGADLPHAWLKAEADSEHYRSIMRFGYEVSRKDGLAIFGNYAWFPGFPLFSQIFHLTVASHFWAVIWGTWTAALASFILLFNLSRRLFSPSAGYWTIAAIAAYPASFFLLIPFPYALAISLGLAYYWALLERRYLLAGLLGFFLGITYPTALLAGLLPLFIIIPRIIRAESPGGELRGLIISGAGLGLGFLAVCVHHWLVLDDFWLPFNAQAKWNRHLSWPGGVLIRNFSEHPVLHPENLSFLLVAAMMALFRWRFRPELWALMLAVILVSPATGSLEADFRHYLMAWPLFMLLGSSPLNYWIKALFIWLMLFLAADIMIPAWLNNSIW
jgi:hypothetical protein